MTDEYRAICKAVPDAVDNLPEDTSLDFEFGQWFPNGPHGMWIRNNLGYYRGMLLSVHFEGRQDRRRPGAPAQSEKESAQWSTCEGSAILVAPGIAITAAHVIEDKIQLIVSGRMGIFCMGPTDDGLQYWRVHNITKVNNSDLMILTLKYWTDLPSNHRFYLPCISTRLPDIGEAVIIAGFQASTVTGPVQEVIDGVPVFAKKNGNATYCANVRAATGKVTRHYLTPRPGIVQGLTFEVDVGTDGGMSGGPVFDQFGNLVGILSSSLEHDDQNGPSVVSLIVTALVQPVEACFGKLLSGSVRLIDLHPHLAQIVGLQNIQVSKVQGSEEIRIELSEWPSTGQP